MLRQTLLCCQRTRLQRQSFWIEYHPLDAARLERIAAASGLSIGIVVLSKGFRRYGVRSGVLTVPQWIGERYGDLVAFLVYTPIFLILGEIVPKSIYQQTSDRIAPINEWAAGNRVPHISAD